MAARRRCAGTLWQAVVQPCAGVWSPARQIQDMLQRSFDHDHCKGGDMQSLVRWMAAFCAGALLALPASAVPLVNALETLIKSVP